MIVLKIDGTLEQQLSQYLFGLACARVQNVTLKLDTSAFTDSRQSHYALSGLAPEDAQANKTEISNAKQSGVIKEETQLFDPLIWEKVRDGFYLSGIWADFRYSETSILRLADTLNSQSEVDTQATSLLESIHSCESVALDLRQNSSEIDTPPHSYFQQAIKVMRARVPNSHLFIFCDTSDSVGEMTEGSSEYTLVETDTSGTAIQQLQLLRACKHHIVTHQSLSSLAARLTHHADGVTIAPLQTFSLDDANLLARFGKVEQPVWPSGWQVLPSLAPNTSQLELIQGGRSTGRAIRIAVWNFYEEITTDGFLFKNTEASIGADLLKPWVDLYEYGKANGLDFVTLDQITRLDEIDAVIFMDRPRPGNPRVEQVLQATSIAKYLLLYECDLIKPDNWDLEYHKGFDRIFTWNDVLADGRRYIKSNFVINRTSPYVFEVLKSAFQQRKLCCLIAGAKASNHPNELYSHRVRAIRWFEATAPQDFDLYGGGWDSANFPSYCGRVNDKLATLSHYRFSICYENAKGIPGYITEKILDCFRAGTVPVYGGAPNIAQWIPKDCYIDIGQFPTYAELYEHLRSMDATTHASYLNRIQLYLTSRESYPFSCECFVATLTQFLVFDVQTRRDEPVNPAPESGTHPKILTMTQDIHTLDVRVAEELERTVLATPDITLTSRETIAAAGHPDLIVYLGYGDELPVFKRARALWEFYLSHFQNIKAFFVRNTDTLPRGEIVSNGYDLLVGVGDNTVQQEAPGYNQTGIWSARENAGVIYKQNAVYDYLLRKYDKPFHLYFSTVTSVVDFRGLLAVLDQMPKTRCFAGQPGRLESPPALSGLSFICGTNTLLSRDMVLQLRNAYDPKHPLASLPNDIWQSSMLLDVLRTPLPFFSFIKPRTTGSNLDDVAHITRHLLADGHFHFRVKTTSAESGLAKREDIDPWIMLKIMETILDSPGAPTMNRNFAAKFLEFTGGGKPDGFPSYPDATFLRGRRDFALTDEEARILYPA